MGLDVGLILSDDRHYDPFLCAICQSMVDLDALVTTATATTNNTTCSHCFCRTCLPFWLERSTTCPTCNCDLMYNGQSNNNSSGGGSSNNASMMIGKRTVMVQPLKIAQPLAYRLLNRVLVECPLNSKGITCGWKGDYGDLETHLLSSTAHDVAATSTTTAAAAARAATDNDSSSAMDVDTNTPASVNNSNNTSSTSTFPTAAPPASAPPPPPPPPHAVTLEEQRQRKISLATSLKEEANDKFASQHYKEANSLYTKAIEVLQTKNTDNATTNDSDNDNDDDDSRKKLLLATLYSNRAATFLQVRDYNACINDCSTILNQLEILDNAKVYIRISRASIQLGQLVQAQKYLQQGLEDESSSSSSSSIPQKQKVLLQKSLSNVQEYIQLQTQGRDHLEQHHFAEAKATYSTLLKEAPSAIPFLLGASQADLGLGLMDSALRLTKGVLMQHAQNPMACWIRGQAMFSMGDQALGLKLLLEALRLDPDSQLIKDSYKRSKKVSAWMQQAEQHVFRRSFAEAVTLYTQCIEMDTQPPLPPKAPLYATLHTSRAEAYLRLKDYTNALKDCAKVLYAHDDYIPACLIRLQAYHGLEQHETALRDVQELLEKYPGDMKLRQAHERADFLYRKSKRVDYYKLLGVSQIATEMEIKKAYKRKALELHPDKHPPHLQEKAQKDFQSLGEGLEILCNDFTRRLYDEGHDLEQIRERVEAAQQAAHNPRYSNHHHGGGHGGHGGFRW